MFQNLDTTVTKFLGDYDITIIEFLDQVLPEYLKENDISVTKFLDSSIGQFLSANDITVTKFLEEDNDISVTKFLTDTAVSNYPVHHRGAPIEHHPRDNYFGADDHHPTWDDDLHHYRDGRAHHSRPVHHTPVHHPIAGDHHGLEDYQEHMHHDL